MNKTQNQTLLCWEFSYIPLLNNMSKLFHAFSPKSIIATTFKCNNSKILPLKYNVIDNGVLEVILEKLWSCQRNILFYNNYPCHRKYKAIERNFVKKDACITGNLKHDVNTIFLNSPWFGYLNLQIIILLIHFNLLNYMWLVSWKDYSMKLLCF